MSVNVVREVTLGPTSFGKLSTSEGQKLLDSLYRKTGEEQGVYSYIRRRYVVLQAKALSCTAGSLYMAFLSIQNSEDSAEPDIASGL